MAGDAGLKPATSLLRGKEIMPLFAKFQHLPLQPSHLSQGEGSFHQRAMWSGLWKGSRQGRIYLPVEPMHQLQVDLADMSVFSSTPYRYMLVAVDTFTRKAAAVPLASKTAPAAANAWQQIVQALGIPSYVYTDDGSEFKAEFKQQLDYFDIDKVVSRGHAYFAIERESLKRKLL